MKKTVATLVFACILLKSCAAQGIDLPCANEVVQASEGCGQSLELFCSSDCYGIALQYYCRTPDDRNALIDACAVSYPASNYPGLPDISSLPSESSATSSAPEGEETSSSAEEDPLSSAASEAMPTSSTAAGAPSSSNSIGCEGEEDCTESAAKPAKTKGPHKNETASESAAILTFQPAANPVLVALLGVTLAFFNALL